MTEISHDTFLPWSKTLETQRSQTNILENLKENMNFYTIRKRINERLKLDKRKMSQGKRNQKDHDRECNPPTIKSFNTNCMTSIIITTKSEMSSKHAYCKIMDNIDKGSDCNL